MKKILSLTLAVLMVLGMTSVAFAAKNPDTAASSYAITEYANVSFNATTSVYSISGEQAIDGAAFYPSTHELAYDDDQIVYSYFIIYKGDPIVKNSLIDKDLNLSVKLRKDSGSAALDKANVGYIKPSATGSGATNSEILRVRLYLSKYLVSTKELDYNGTITLYSDGKRVTDSKITVDSTLDNIRQKDLDSDYDGDTLSIADGFIFEFDAYTRDLTIEVSDDAAINGNFFANRKVYLNLRTDDLESSDEQLIDKYAFDDFLWMPSVNVPTNAKMVFSYSDNMYAYTVDADGNLTYVGRTRDSGLPFYSKYYISTKQLDLPTAEVDEPVIDEPLDEPLPIDEDPGADTGNAGGGGDDVIPSEANNYNPGTGR